MLGNSKAYSMVQVFDYIQRKKDKRKKEKIIIRRKLIIMIIRQEPVWSKEREKNETKLYNKFL